MAERKTARHPRNHLSIAEQVMLAAVLIALVAAAVLSGGDRAAGTQNIDLRTVHVAPGDTLWSIARQHMVPGLTTAQTVDLIARHNRLRDASLSPGSELVVPERVSLALAVASR